MAEAVYILCTLTSLACTLLLFNGYRREGARLLFWAALCFAGLTVNNLLLFVDLVMVPEVDLSVARSAIALVALFVLIYGLVWEST
jgi:hydrogenase/urease accessory protein HupE